MKSVWISLFLCLLLHIPSYAGQAGPNSAEKVSVNEKVEESSHRRFHKKKLIRKFLGKKTTKKTGEKMADIARLLGILNLVVTLIALFAPAFGLFLVSLAFGIVPLTLGFMALYRMKKARVNEGRSSAIAAIVLGGISLGVFLFIGTWLLCCFPA